MNFVYYLLLHPFGIVIRRIFGWGCYEDGLGGAWLDSAVEALLHASSYLQPANMYVVNGASKCCEHYSAPQTTNFNGRLSVVVRTPDL
jgi:hypothetical protein